MSDQATVAPSIGFGDLAAHIKRRDNFFLGMSGVLFLILLAGFSQTLYLRVFFDVSPIPLYLHVHGAVVTCWFLWLISQTSLVAIRRTDTHRRIGLVGVVLGVAVVGAGLMATFGLVPRLAVMGIDLDSASGGIWGPQSAISFFSWVVSINFLMLSGFVGFLSGALLLRRRPDMHKRLMLLASMSLMPPPLARIAYWPMFGWIEEIPFVTATSLLLLVPLGLHDLLASKRLHIATIIGGLCFAVIILAPVWISNIEFAQAFVRGLG